MKYYIWSNEHQLWWKPGSQGYTDKIGEAGVYSEKESAKLIKGTYLRKDGLPEEIRIPTDDVGLYE